MGNNRNDKIIFIDSCQHCGRVLKEEWKFCPYCKAQVETSDCPFCREEIKVQWEFCPYCINRVKNLTGEAFEDSNAWLRTILKKE